MDNPNRIAYFAETDFRSQKIKFGIKESDRARHMYVIGKTGMGKSTLLENLAVQDIRNGNGIGFIDPHGSSAEELLNYIPKERIRDVIYFAPFDQDHPIAFNVMEDIGKDQRPLIASGLLGAFKKVWVDAWSPRMEYLLSNALLALLEYPGSTLLGVNRIFADKDFRNMIVDNVKDPSVKSFWTEEFAKYNERYATEAAAAIQNKVGQFAANPLIRNMMGQMKSSFDFRQVMDGKKIFIANLAKGRIGEGNASLIGGMLITKLYLAAMSRADMNRERLQGVPPFYLYVDEFQSFANESFADILSEARKYKLSLTIAHQYIEQMSEEVQAAVFGNVGTTIAFRVGAFDAEVLEKEFAPAFTGEDLVNLGFAQVYLKLMIDGIGSAPFSATTLPRPPYPEVSHLNEVVQASREQFSRERAPVEEAILSWHAPIHPPARPPERHLQHGTGGNTGDRPMRRNPGPSGPVRPREPRGVEAPRVAHPRPISQVAQVPHQGYVQAEETHTKPRVEQKEEPNRAKLSELSHRDKSPSSKNVQSLRDALAKAMEEHNGKGAKERESLPKAETIHQVSQEVKKATERMEEEKGPKTKEEKRQEVPEDVLRSVLH